MKSLSQIVLAIVAVVGLVAGITFVKQYQVGGSEPTPVPSVSKTLSSAAEVQLTFPTTIWKWNPPADGQFEQRGPRGWRDFWFQNDNAVPVELGLKSKSCKCSDVSVCVLPPDQAKRYQSAASDKGGASTNNLTTKPLEVDDVKGVTVGPGEGGFVRLAWEDKKDRTPEERHEQLVVEVWTQAVGGGPKSIDRLELPLTFVPPLRVTPPNVQLGDLNPRDEKTVTFKCWSSTRPRFSLSAKERSGEPCFTCSCTPLTDQERSQLADATKSHVLCGYLVRVIVRERLSDAVQMDLGPFVRRIDLTSDPEIEPASVLVTGVVRGDVTVGTEDDKGRIELGFFSAKKGITKTVKLTAHRPNLKLSMGKVEPAENPLKVKSLTELQPPLSGGRTRWELCVEVPPGGPSGKLPDHSAVLLKMDGNPPRQIRIPVQGSATQ